MKTPNQTLSNGLRFSRKRKFDELPKVVYDEESVEVVQKKTKNEKRQPLNERSDNVKVVGLPSTSSSTNSLAKLDNLMWSKKLESAIVCSKGKINEINKDKVLLEKEIQNVHGLLEKELKIKNDEYSFFLKSLLKSCKKLSNKDIVSLKSNLIPLNFKFRKFSMTSRLIYKYINI